MNNRIDIELVNRRLFETRSKAQEAISAGLIFCNGNKVLKANHKVIDDDKLEIVGKVMPYVSRGGLKLEKALEVFNINLEGKVMLDIGSSTGGFTDCALQNNIKKVIAVDVGKNQLDPKIKNNNLVEVYEQMDFRNIEDKIISMVDIVAIDVSFISVIKLLDKLSKMKEVKEIICLIKPQFECGKEMADKYHGVILNKEVHEILINNLITEFNNTNFNCNNLTFSPITGGDGNIEYLGYFTKENMNVNKSYIKGIVSEAFQNYKK